MSQKTPNTISSDVEIKGTVTFEHDLIADGRIEGEILSAGTLTVGENGSIDGDISAGHVYVFGNVNGNIIAEQRVELKKDSELTGDLTAPRVTIEEGATFVGRANVTPGRAATKSPAALEKKQA